MDTNENGQQTESPVSAPLPNPVVSIVVPVYNCEDYLAQCLDSLLGQSYGAIELVCVDDGSTDSSGDILRDYADRDGRVRVITQENAGPARARNVGRDAATGDYLLFFDCDDWCEPELVARAVSRAQSTGADIVALPHYVFDQRIGVPIPAFWALLPDKYPADVCSWHDNPDWLFRSFQNLPWNKLLRMEFVRENDLRFQEDIRLTEDLMFSAPALVRAERLTFLPDMLVYHREGTGTNTMSAKDKHPLDFIVAFRALKAFLEEEGVYEQLRIAYVNWAIDGFIYNVHTLNTYEGFAKVMDALTGDDGALAELGLADVSDDDLQEERFGEFLRDVQQQPTDYLYKLYVIAREDRDERGNRLAVEYYANEDQQRAVDDANARAAVAERERDELRAQLDGLRCAHENLQQEFDAQMNAAEQKVGQAICWVPRRIQEAVLRKRRGTEGEE